MSKFLYMVVAFALLVPGCGGDVTGLDAPGTAAEPAWVWQNPLPHAYDHSGVVAFGGGRALALTGLDAFETTNDGDTWRPVGLPGTRHRMIYRRDSLIAVVNDTFVNLSTDAGRSWRPSADHDLALGRAVAFRDAQHGVVVGSGGEIVATGDGGATWTRRFSGTTSDLIVVEYLDADVVIAGGVGGLLIRSTNGGATWSQLDGTGATYAIDAIDITAGVVRAVNSVGDLLTSTDGGETWSERDIEELALYSIDFLDAVRGVAAGHSGRILHTTDGGLNWSSTPQLSPYPISGVSYAALDDVWAVGRAGRIHRSTDAGATWSDIHSGARPDLYSVSFANTRVGMAVGRSETTNGPCGLLITTDGGATWSQGTIGASTTSCEAGDLNAVWMIDAQRAVVVGPGGSLWTTSDGGASWTERDSKTTLELHDVAFADESRGIAVGEFGQVRVTSNGGGTWSAPVGGAGTSEDLAAVTFATPDIAMLVGGNGTVRRTVAGGTAWTPAENGVPATPLYDVAMLDANTAVTIGRDGVRTVALRTTDGGANWGASSLDGSISRGAIAFDSNAHGYIVMTEGWMHITDDGGQTWELQDRVTGRSLWGVCAPDQRTAYVVGQGGVILRTTTGGR